MCYELDRMSAQELVLQIQDGYRRRTPFVLTKGFRRVYPQTDALSLRIREDTAAVKELRKD
jgi:hypothetical protein